MLLRFFGSLFGGVDILRRELNGFSREVAKVVMNRPEGNMGAKVWLLALTLDFVILKPNSDVLRPDIDIVRPDIDILRPDIDILRPDIDILRTDFDILRPDIDISSAGINISC